MTITETHTIPEAKFFELLDKLERMGLSPHLIEYADGVLLPTQGNTPFSSELITLLLQTEDENDLYQQIPMPISRHSLIIGKLNFQLQKVIEENDLPFEVFPDGLHVFIRPEKYYVPDVILTSQDYQLNEKDQLLNPMVIFEVASPSTEGKDQGEKLRAYTNIESLKTYVLISQDEKLIQRYVRSEEAWAFSYFLPEDKTFSLGEVPISLEIEQLYKGVKFS